MNRPLLIPPHVAGFCITIEIVLIFVFKQCRVIPFPYNLSGILLILLGQGLIISANSHMKRCKTTFTYQKSTSLVTSGPFDFSRNPMYLGLIIVLSGLSILVSNAIGFLLPLLSFAFFQWYFIPFEEWKSSQEFGDAYEEYRKKVRRWL